MSLTLTAAVRTNKPKRDARIIDGGFNYSAAINSKGLLFFWGTNAFAQFGNNSTASRLLTPVSVGGAVKTFCKITTNANSSLAIDKNGRVWGWGLNSSGQLGDNSTISRLTPVSVRGAVKTFCAIETGGNHSIAIDKNGRAWGWGSNASGQLGDNSTINRLTPVSVLGAVKTFCRINTFSNGFTSLAIDKNGRAWGWGNNGNGRIGDNSAISRLTPVSVGGAVKTFCQITAGGSHSLAIDKNGRAWGWGNNGNGQLGDDSTISRLTPVSVGGAVKTFCEISGGSNYSLAIDKNGSAWGWGLNNDSQLGNNSTIVALTPVSVYGGKTFCKIVAGNTHSLAIDKNNRAWGWGSDTNGQLGTNSITVRLTPVSILGAVKTFCDIKAAIGAASFAMDKNGITWEFGGQNMLTPIRVGGAVKTFCKIVLNGIRFAIDKNGNGWTWGFNNAGQLGNNSTINGLTPVSVGGAAKTFCKIASGNVHTFAIDKDGRAWGWGNNGFGRVGDGSTISRLTPVSLGGAVKTFCEIGGGNNHSIAIDKNGIAWGWGFGPGGLIGNNSTICRCTPVSVHGGRTFCQISCGANHTLAIDLYGRVWAWGQNGQAQLGTGSFSNSFTPISIRGAIKTFCKVSSGQFHSLAIDKYGRAWAWGRSTSGQVGDNSLIGDRLTPVSVAGNTKTFCIISAGGVHSLAIDKYGRAWAWGTDSRGQLGLNQTQAVSTPVQVCNI